MNFIQKLIFDNLIAKTIAKVLSWFPFDGNKTYILALVNILSFFAQTTTGPIQEFIMTITNIIVEQAGITVEMLNAFTIAGFFTTLWHHIQKALTGKKEPEVVKAEEKQR